MSLIKLPKILISIILLALAIYFIGVTKFDIVSDGEGVLTINDSNVNILSPSSGIIKEIEVTSGDQVKVGQRLLTITNFEDENKRELLEFNVKFFTEQIEKQKKELKILQATSKNGYPVKAPDGFISTKLLLVQNKYDTYIQRKKELKEKEKNIDLKEVSLNDQESILQDKSKMIKKSLGNTVRFLDSQLEVEKIKFQNLESKIMLEEAKSLVDTAYLEFIQIVLEQTEQTETELKKNRESFAQTTSELNTVKERIQSTDIIATVNGTVLSIQDGLSSGVYIERNADIMTLKREDDGIFIEAKFDSKYRPYLGIGEKAKIKINAPGIKDYFIGTIDGISVDSFNYEEYAKKEGRYYKVKVNFKTDDKKLVHFNELLGIKTTVYVVNDQMTFIQYILSTFNKDLDFTVW